MRCTSRWPPRSCTVSARAATTFGPKVMTGTKWPSITSTWNVRAPASRSSTTWLLKFPKSADRIDGRTRVSVCQDIAGSLRGTRGVAAHGLGRRLVGREERLDRELGHGDVDGRTERRDGAQEAELPVAAAEPQRDGDLLAGCRVRGGLRRGIGGGLAQQQPHLGIAGDLDLAAQ